jgi:plastocyanin
MRKMIWAALVGLLLVMLAACGGGGDSTKLAFEGNDAFQFSPAAAEVKAGGQAEVTFKNVGVLQHTWVLVPDDVDLATVSEADAINGATTGVVPGGESRSITFVAPEAGTYKYVCTIAGHALAGMVGTLTVTP